MKQDKVAFSPPKLQKELHVEKILRARYFDFPSTFVFKSQTHDYWELLYVDKGEIGIIRGQEVYHLKTGQIIFNRPNQFHDVFCNGKITPNLINICFACNSPGMSFFDDKIIELESSMRSNLITIIDESKASFSGDLANPNLKELVLKETAPIYAKELITISIESFLINLIRKNLIESDPPQTSLSEKDHIKEVHTIIDYLEINISNNLTLDNICINCSINGPAMQKTFAQHTGWSIMEYFYHLKIEEAKRLIRAENCNFTQIADKLGYSTIYYFSRQFKKIVGLSPSEYSKLILALPKEDREKQL